jgi:GDP-4-dehydro-6-deoxy-D-mannose reductase
MNALITGSNGFVGRHLAEHLRRRGSSVFGVDVHDRSWAPWVKYEQVDITDLPALLGILTRWRVDEVYHLAAIANPHVANDAPYDAVNTNVMGSVTLLECARKRQGLKILFVGSSEQYRTKTGGYVRYEEHDELRPHNLYGATKIAFEVIGREYQRLHGIDVYFTRSFNHTGPGQAPQYVLASFARQVLAIKNGDQEPAIRVGNVKASRDFTDVRDVAAAYEAIVLRGIPGEIYNVCSGRVHQLEDLLRRLIDIAGIQEQIELVVDPDLLRSDDPAVVFGDNSKLTLHTGWTPSFDMTTTLQDLLDT